jgi:hypothetical protein
VQGQYKNAFTFFSLYRLHNVREEENSAGTAPGAAWLILHHIKVIS